MLSAMLLNTGELVLIIPLEIAASITGVKLPCIANAAVELFAEMNELRFRSRRTLLTACKCLHLQAAPVAILLRLLVLYVRRRMAVADIFENAVPLASIKRVGFLSAIANGIFLISLLPHFPISIVMDLSCSVMVLTCLIIMLVVIPPLDLRYTRLVCGTTLGRRRWMSLCRRVYRALTLKRLRTTIVMVVRLCVLVPWHRLRT